MRTLATLCTVLMIVLAAPAAAQVEVDSVWVNQSGSTMTVTAVNPDRSFVRYYINNNTSFSCVRTRYPLLGWVNGNAIGWTVNWANSSQNCWSVTAWGGYFTPTAQIATKWTLGYGEPNRTPGIQVGADTFTRQ